MKIHEIKFKGSGQNYSIIIGKNILSILPKKIKHLCSKTKKIGLIIDKNVPNKFIKILKKKLNNYDLFFYSFTANEKVKSLKTANYYLEKLIKDNFNRSDLIIAVGGGITGDVIGFVASTFKRGINFINVPTTLLAQVDASIGGKTGVNSKYGKNLIGSFFQPRLVLSDTSFLDTISKREMICGYAEILKHSIIKDKKFFNWLKKNTKNILLKDNRKLRYAIKKSCQIKIFFVSKDVNEKNLRMILNFGHTFAHAIEVKNNFSNKFTHGEAVLAGMILEGKLSVIRRKCTQKTFDEIKKIYSNNNLDFTFKKFDNRKKIDALLPYLQNDKKNEDQKINFILLSKISKTTLPNSNKISLKKLKSYSKFIVQY